MIDSGEGDENARAESDAKPVVAIAYPRREQCSDREAQTGSPQFELKVRMCRPANPGGDFRWPQDVTGKSQQPGKTQRHSHLIEEEYGHSVQRVTPQPGDADMG
jgi:hypothetical protein